MSDSLSAIQIFYYLNPIYMAETCSLAQIVVWKVQGMRGKEESYALFS